MSTMANVCIEDVTKAAPNAIKWLQLYVPKDRTVSEKLMKRAERCGFKAVVLTIDTPIIGIRLGEQRTSYNLPKGLTAANFTEDNDINDTVGRDATWAEQSTQALNSSLSWKDIKWIQSITSMPVLVKGVLTSEDAVCAVQHGVSGIVVSNHGGRQLDSSPATVSICVTLHHALTELYAKRSKRCQKWSERLMESVKYMWMEASELELMS